MTASRTATPRATRTSCSRSTRSTQFCLERGWPYEPWATFAEIHRWLDEQLAAFAADPASLAGPVARRPFCGAEVWGPDRVDPPASDALPPHEGRVPG